MKKAKFWVDWLLEAGDANVCHRFWFEIELEDEFYEELFERINAPAINSLNELVEKNASDCADPIDVYWEISKETEDAF